MKRIFAAVSIAALAACTTANPDVIRPYEAQRLSTVYDATVLSVRPVTVEGSQSGVGTGVGAVAGGVAAGSNIGRGSGSVVAAVIGAVAGGIIGNAIEKNATKENAVEIMVQLRNGERRAVVQGNTGEVWQPGDAVVLVTTGGRTRINHAPQIVPEPAPAVYPSQPVPPRS